MGAGSGTLQRLPALCSAGRGTLLSGLPGRCTRPPAPGAGARDEGQRAPRVSTEIERCAPAQPTQRGDQWVHAVALQRRHRLLLGQAALDADLQEEVHLRPTRARAGIWQGGGGLWSIEASGWVLARPPVASKLQRPGRTCLISASVTGRFCAVASGGGGSGQHMGAG